MRQAWLTGGLTGAVIAALVLGYGTRLHASNGARAGRVACVNVGTVINEYQRSKDLDEEMMQLDEQLQAEEEQRRQKIDELKATLDRIDPSDSTYVERTRELLELQIDYKNWGEVKQAHRVREFSLWTVKIYREILDATAVIAEKEGYDMVFYRGEFDPASMDPQAVMDQMRAHKLLYARPSNDVTQQVIDHLNEQYRAEPRKKMLYVP